MCCGLFGFQDAKETTKKKRCQCNFFNVLAYIIMVSLIWLDYSSPFSLTNRVISLYEGCRQREGGAAAGGRVGVARAV